MIETLTRKEFLKSTTVLGAVAAAGALLWGRDSAEASVFLRPPGALEEDEFLARCIRCGQCGQACPNRCIVGFTRTTGKPFSAVPGPGEEGTPVIFPRRQACTLCQADQGDALLCTAACPTGALRRVQKTPEEILSNVSMGLATVDTRLCWSYNDASCGVCVRACPLGGKALRAGPFETPIVDPEYCVGCGLCERSCVRYPQAISVVPRGRETR